MIPMSHRSPYVLTSVRVITGVGERVPFFMTRTAHHFSATNILPSGAKVIAVGILRREAIVSTSKPATAQTLDICIPKNTISKHTKEGIFFARMYGINEEYIIIKY